MMLVDSHCHLDCLDLSLFDGQLDNVMRAAHEHDVRHFLCVCINLTEFPQVLAIAKRYANVFASLGLHPTEVVDNPTVDQLCVLASDDKVVAIGETGLDYYRIEGDSEWQRERFRRHIRAAIAMKKPLIIHTREASEDTLRIMKEENAASIGGVMHCFTENLDVAQRAMDLNFYISISGIVTFKNATTVHEVAKTIPIERLLIETDAPYLAPVPHRGKPNQPAYVKYVAQHIADLRQMDVNKLAQMTTDNFFTLFSGAVRSA